MIISSDYGFTTIIKFTRLGLGTMKTSWTTVLKFFGLPAALSISLNRNSKGLKLPTQQIGELTVKVFNVTFAMKIARKLPDGSYGTPRWTMLEDSITEQELSEVSTLVNEEGAYLRLSSMYLHAMKDTFGVFDGVDIEVSITETKD